MHTACSLYAVGESLARARCSDGDASIRVPARSHLGFTPWWAERAGRGSVGVLVSVPYGCSGSGGPCDTDLEFLSRNVRLIGSSSFVF